MMISSDSELRGESVVVILNITYINLIVYSI
jgi:hypothetical protein